jgi:hypothetical protein
MNVTMKNEDDHFSRTLSFVTDQHKKVSPPPHSFELSAILDYV